MTAAGKTGTKVKREGADSNSGTSKLNDVVPY